MLDIRTSCLLKIINEKCKVGSYKVIAISELISLMPAKFEPDSDLIRQMITALSNGGYISLKFDKNQEYCLSPTPKGRSYFEKESENSSNIKQNQTNWLNYLYNGISTFLAVFLAVILLRLIGVLC